MIPPRHRLDAKDRTLVLCLATGLLVILLFASLRIVLGPSGGDEAPARPSSAVLARTR